MPEFIFESTFHEVAALLVLASGIGFLGLLLKQPLIVSFIAVGILAGPSVLGVTQSGDHIELLSQLGIAILLFLVGIKLDLNLVRTLGPVALATGLGQVFFTAIIGFGIGLTLGLDWLTSLYVAVALTFSSTIIIVKLLSDKREIDSLHGRIALGFLIVQDIVVIFAMIVLSALAGAQGDMILSNITQIFIYGAGLIFAIGIFIRYIATPLVTRLIHSSELLSVFTISWAAFLAAVSDYLGFSMELGGLLAGVSLASTPFREAIASRLSSLRDFLLLFFFIALGAHLDLSIINQQIAAAVIFSLFVLIGNPLIVLSIMGAMGYRKRTGFLAGLTVAQISEFSLIFMAMGITLGHVNNAALGLVTLVGLITIAISTYMITYSHRLYRLCEPFIGLFERKNPYQEEIGDTGAQTEQFDIILIGLGRYGNQIAQKLVAQGVRFLGVDFNPAVVRNNQSEPWPIIYGDATDPEFIESLPLSGIKWVISAVPEHNISNTYEDHRLVLIRTLRHAHYKGKIAVFAHGKNDIENLYRNGVTLVLQPFQDAAEKAVEIILKEEGRT